jgi:RecJ-like exonuclease
MESGKKYSVEVADGNKFKAVFMSEFDGVSQFVGYMYYTKDIVSAVEVAAKVSNKKKLTVVCSRCGGSGQYRNHGECYGCGGRTKIRR